MPVLLQRMMCQVYNGNQYHTFANEFHVDPNNISLQITIMNIINYSGNVAFSYEAQIKHEPYVILSHGYI